MAIVEKPGGLPHVSWLDLKNNGVLTECAVMKRDVAGNITFIEIPSLDDVDKKRLTRILLNRNAKEFELWDLMSQITINNGMNALNYFHQLVKIITPRGVIMNPKDGVVGTGYASVTTGNPVPSGVVNQTAEEAATSMADQEALRQVIETAAEAPTTPPPRPKKTTTTRKSSSTSSKSS